MARLIYASPRKYSTLSRYGMYNQIVDTDNNNAYLESTNKIELNSDNELFHVVDPTEENRLDIISNTYYGTPNLYWAIAMANNILDPMIVVRGTVLKIPSYESLYKTGGPLIRRG